MGRHIKEVGTAGCANNREADISKASARELGVILSSLNGSSHKNKAAKVPQLPRHRDVNLESF